MDGVFKVPGCRTSVALRSCVPAAPPRVPAKSMENLTAWRNNQPLVKLKAAHFRSASTKFSPPSGDALQVQRFEIRSHLRKISKS